MENENDHNSVAAVERWLTSPVVTQTSAQGEIQHQYHHGNSLNLLTQKGTNETSHATVTAANRGKTLLRERLKQKAMKEQQKKSIKQETSTENSQSTLSPFKPDGGIHIIPMNDMGKITKEAAGNTTPSTAASTRSSYSLSKSTSLAHTLSGLTINNSQSSSPQHMFHLSPRNNAHHTRRSIEITDLDAIHNPYPRFPAPSKLSAADSASLSITANSVPSSSTSSNSGSGSNGTGSLRSGQVSRSSTSNKIISPETMPVTTKSQSSSASSKLRSSETLLRISQQSGSRMRIHRQSTASHQESDEEREKVDVSNMQRAQTKLSDHRQQHAPSLPRKNRIKLHVYDLIAQETIMQLPWGCHFPIGQCFNALNSGLHTLGTGAYHVGIEINGIEYAYGANDTRGLTGVFTCMPKSSPGYQYRTTIDLGDRALIRQVQSSGRGEGPKQRFVDGREVVREMASEYMGADYDLLRKNCVTFAHDACLRLGVKDSEVPEWFRNLCLAGAAAQDAANSTMAPLSRVFSSCDREGLVGIVKDAGFEVISDDRAGHSEHIVETHSAATRPQ